MRRRRRRRHEEEKDEAGGGGGGMRRRRRRRRRRYEEEEEEQDEHTNEYVSLQRPYSLDQKIRLPGSPFRRQLRARSRTHLSAKRRPFLLLRWSTALQILAVASTHTTYQHVHV